MDQRCLTLDPIGIYEWMGRTADAPAYSPFGYGYTNYSRDGYCRFPLQFTDAPGVRADDPSGTVIGGTGIAVSAFSPHRDAAADYAFWIAGADCQKGLYLRRGRPARQRRRLGRRPLQRRLPRFLPRHAPDARHRLAAPAL